MLHLLFLLVIERIIAMLKGEYTYPELETELKEMLNELGREICTLVLNELDKKTYENKKERKDWIVVQKDCERTIVTPFGDVTYKRWYYKNKKPAEAKCIYIHEGKQELTKGRYKLKNPVYFSGIYEKEEIKDLWERV